MSDPTHQVENREALVDLLAEAPIERGWWFTSPIYVVNSSVDEKNTRRIIDFFPHLGTIFGFAADAATVLLHEMGLVKQFGSTFRNVLDGWSQLSSLEQLHGLVETVQLHVDGGRYLIIGIGKAPPNPRELWTKFKKGDNNVEYSGRRLFSYTTTRDSARNFFAIIRGSYLFNKALKKYLQEVNNIGSSNCMNSSSDSEFCYNSTTSDTDDEEVVADFTEFFDKKSYPILYDHKHSTDRDHLLKLAREVNRALLATDERTADANDNNIHKKRVDALLKCGGIRYEDPDTGAESMLMKFSHGNSIPFLYKSTKIINKIISFIPTTEEALADFATKVLCSLEQDHCDQFQEVASDRGDSRSINIEKISATYWNSMSIAASLNVKQQRIIRKYLYHHFGRSLVESQKKTFEEIGEYIPFDSIELIHKDKRDITGKEKK